MASEVEKRYWPKPEDHAEIQRYFDQVKEIDKAPKEDRREGAEDWLEAMRDRPKEVGDCVYDMLTSNYGYGAGVKARQVAAAKGMNRIWHLGIMVAGLRYQCPSGMATVQWKKLSRPQQLRVNNEVARAIQRWERGEGITVTPVRGTSGYLREPGHEGGRPRTSRVPRLTR